MNNIIEFNSVRNTFHRATLQAVGLTNPLTWQLIGAPKAEYCYKGFVARPHYVAYNREQETLTVIHMETGRRPTQLNLATEMVARLETVVVAAVMKRKNPSLRAYTPRVVYDDGGQFDMVSIDAQDWAEYKVFVKNQRKKNGDLDVDIEAAITGMPDALLRQTILITG